ncbi:CDP-glycerol glycerophosphotransferase family protein [Nesterenkonia sphaerica]|uniref:CDP-glycerol glycerophosphotransferase family protein n=1 Tax=Nesterenkonia sphaerica TaxID=1804988 RepID=A0A5R9A9T8_9MICC|nr:CDP-glycerol glycerophosphotransferase family protein [Nesterenkonia sphaerica]TLP75542.1 CDP-glycerol glycerophosphotransferase family protein [Nesterenkonia sphaerica]
MRRRDGRNWVLENRILTTPLGIMIIGARSIYALMKLLPVQRKVVLITREPRQITVDFRLLVASLHRKHPDHRVVVINHRKLSAAYIPKAFREMYHLATCAGCLVDGYIIPVSILNHRKGLRIGQIWHALGAIKKFGHLASGTREGPNPRVAATMRMHQNYTFVCAAGQVPATIYTEAFGVPAQRIEPLGMPRVDYLLDDTSITQRRERIFRRYPQLRESAANGARVVLYTPTFRRGKNVPYTEIAAAFSEHDDAAHSLVLLPHPFDKSPIPSGGRTIIGTDTGVLDWLTVADAVITDYSAVTYEATLRDIPLVFWPYDIADYTQARGLAVDYHTEVPGPVVSSAAEAVRTALTSEEPDYRRFRSQHLTFVTQEDGSLPEVPPACADRIVDALELGR